MRATHFRMSVSAFIKPMTQILPSVGKHWINEIRCGPWNQWREIDDSTMYNDPAVLQQRKRGIARDMRRNRLRRGDNGTLNPTI